MYFYTESRDNLSESLPHKTIRGFVIRHILMALHRSLYNYVRFFPTERTTFITFQYKRVEEEDTPESELTPKPSSLAETLPWPVGNLVRLIVSVGSRSNGKQIESRLKDESTARLVEIARLLETDILGGNVDFRSQEAGVTKELLYRADQNIDIEMPLVSSMVKELSPLDLYLKYLAKQNELIVLDEPEMNLHPEAQAKLVELLAMLVNAGLKILLTTHSPYLIDHLVNLMKAAEYDNKEEIVNKFYLKKEDAFISKEKVSVYMFNNGAAESILDQEV